MAFELIFGESAVPGSSAVLDKLLALRQQEDVMEFLREFRSRVSGESDDDDDDDSGSDTGELEESCMTAYKRGHYEEAYSLYLDSLKSSDSGFDQKTVDCVCKALIALKRYKEAIVVASRSDEEATELRAEAYYRLGYRQVTNFLPISRQLCRTIDEESGDSPTPSLFFSREDLIETYFEIASIDGSMTWQRHMFPLTHACSYVQARKINPFQVLHEIKGEFFAKLKSNTAMTELLTRASTTILDAQQYEVLTTFIMFVDSIDSPKAWAYLMPFCMKLFEFYASKQFATSYATLLSLKERPMESFFNAVWQIVNKRFLCSTDDGGQLSKFNCSPFNDFAWYCNAAVIPFFTAVEVTRIMKDGKKAFSKGQSSKTSSHTISSTLLGLLRKLLLAPGSNLSINDGEIEEARKLELLKAFDLFLTVSALTFVEWKLKLYADTTFLNPCRTTERELLAQISGFTNDVLKYLAKSNNEHILLSHHVSSFVMMASRFEELMGRLDYLNKEGKEFLLNEIPNFARGSADSGDFTKLSALADCNKFTTFFMNSLTRKKIDGLLKIRNDGAKQAVYRLFEVFADLLSVSKTSGFALSLYRQGRSHLIEFALEENVLGSYVSYRFLALSLASSTEECRLRWRNSPLVAALRRMASKLFDLFLNPTSMNRNDTVNCLLALRAIVCQKPQLVSPASLFEDESTRKVFLQRLSRWMQKASTETSSKQDQVSSRLTTMIVSVVLADFAKCDHGFGVMLHQQKRERLALISELENNLKAF